MTRKRKDQLADAPGQDSFLDIVANLVGILIILVMVIGVRAKDAILEAAPVTTVETPEVDVDELQQEVTQAAKSATDVEQAIHQLNAKIKRQDMDLEYRKQERQRLQLMVMAADEVIANHRSDLDESKQAEFDLQAKIIASQSELDQLQRDIGSVQSADAPVAVLEHLPTPMAQTVFGKELHFRLEKGRLAYVPWDELVEQLRQDAPRRLWKLRQQDEFTETLGPLEGFWLKYTLVRRDQATQTRIGVAVQQGAELDHFVVVPVNDQLGEPPADWFQNGSRLMQILRRNPPASSTITVWTYPDSFHEFRELKKQLFERGYLTASRPLPPGRPIGGSPRGTRSAAQ